MSRWWRARRRSIEKDRRDLDRDVGLSHLCDAALVFQRPRAGHPDQRARTLPGLSRSRHESGSGITPASTSRASRTTACRSGISRQPSGSRSNGSSDSWRGVVMDTYALEKLTGWTPELSPPPDTPLFWRVARVWLTHAHPSPLVGEGGAKRRMRGLSQVEVCVERTPHPSERALAPELPSPQGGGRSTVSLLAVTLAQKSLARSASAGRGSAVKGSGRVTSMAARPSRAVSRPLSTPSPSRCESFAAMPWPSICCTRLSPIGHAAGDRRDDR